MLHMPTKSQNVGSTLPATKIQNQKDDFPRKPPCGVIPPHYNTPRLALLTAQPKAKCWNQIPLQIMNSELTPNSRGNCQ